MTETVYYTRAAYNREQWEARVHAHPITWMMHDLDVGSYLGGSLGRVQAEVRTRGKKRLIKALSLLNGKCVGKPSYFCETAARILRAYYSARKGVFKEGLYGKIVDAALYLAGRITGYPYNVDKGIAGFAMRMAGHLSIRVPISKTYTKSVVERITDELPPIVQLYTMKILDTYSASSTIRVRAVASAYVAAKIANVEVTINSLARKGGVTDQSVRQTLKKMGVKVVYKNNNRTVYEWWQGKDNVGLITPEYVAREQALCRNCGYKVEIGKPIVVEIFETGRSPPHL